MRRISTIAIGLLGCALSWFAYAETSATAPQYLQVIQVVNFLSNTTISSPGMTPTSVSLQFYDDNSGKACWTTTLAYQADLTIHAGPGQNCPNLINQVIITPIPVATVLMTYAGPHTVSIDLTKYAHQITVLQNAAPVFDTASGLVATSGSIKVETQAQFKG